MKKILVLILTLCMCSVAHAKRRKVKIDSPTLSKYARRNKIAMKEYGKPYKKLSGIRRAAVRTAADNAKIEFANTCGDGSSDHYLIWHTYHLKWGMNGYRKWRRNKRRKSKKTECKKCVKPKPRIIIKKIVVKEKCAKPKCTRKPPVKRPGKKYSIYNEKSRVSASGYYLEQAKMGRSSARGGGAAVNARWIRQLGDTLVRLEFALDTFGAKMYCGGWFAGSAMSANFLVGGVVFGNNNLNAKVLAGFGTDIFYVRGYQNYSRFKVADGLAKGLLVGRVDSRFVSGEARGSFGFGNHYHLGNRHDMFRAELLLRGEAHVGKRVDISLTLGAIKDLYHAASRWKSGFWRNYGRGCLLVRIKKGLYVESCGEMGRLGGYAKSDYVKFGGGVGLEL